MFTAEWVLYLTGEMKVPYISEIAEDAPEEIKKQYWAYRKELEEMIEKGIPIPGV